ncbi:hypothetical protein [Lusitaniella coriacea]|uniref:hypothetical protein n=1 Tax=Lusitaniella coriacea TaxID=1983105 RepID=UPI003CEB3940
MNKAIRDILDKIEQGTGKERERAILEIALIIEMNTLTLPEQTRIGRYELSLPWNFLFIRLDFHEQVEIAKKLSQIFIESDDILHGILWALGKTDRGVGLYPLTNIIFSRSEDFDTQGYHQAFLSLDNCLSHFDETELESYSILEDERIKGFIEKCHNLSDLERFQFPSP